MFEVHVSELTFPIIGIFVLIGLIWLSLQVLAVPSTCNLLTQPSHRYSRTSSISSAASVHFMSWYNYLTSLPSIYLLSASAYLLGPIGAVHACFILCYLICAHSDSIGDPSAKYIAARMGSLHLVVIGLCARSPIILSHSILLAVYNTTWHHRSHFLARVLLKVNASLHCTGLSYYFGGVDAAISAWAVQAIAVRIIWHTRPWAHWVFSITCTLFLAYHFDQWWGVEMGYLQACLCTLYITLCRQKQWRVGFYLLSANTCLWMLYLQCSESLLIHMGFVFLYVSAGIVERFPVLPHIFIGHLLWLGGWTAGAPGLLQSLFIILYITLPSHTHAKAKWECVYVNGIALGFYFADIAGLICSFQTLSLVWACVHAFNWASRQILRLSIIFSVAYICFTMIESVSCQCIQLGFCLIIISALSGYHCYSPIDQWKPAVVYTLLANSAFIIYHYFTFEITCQWLLFLFYGSALVDSNLHISLSFLYQVMSLNVLFIGWYLFEFPGLIQAMFLLIYAWRQLLQSLTKPLWFNFLFVLWWYYQPATSSTILFTLLLLMVSSNSTPH